MIPEDARFGKYELLEQIGEGGMAEVYLAKSKGAAGLEKKLVIKKILSDYADRDRFVDMFKSEAKIGVDLNHPNIVQVYDFGKIYGDYFLAMEYVDGFDLGDIISTSRREDVDVPVGIAVFVAAQVAKGLHYAHNRENEYGEPLEIIHRDITPQNILISEDGTVKVADFGIATASTVGEIDESIKGKYAYMSPEQASGEVVDWRTDLFSLGVILFELITGERLFDRETKSETISLVKSGVIPDVGNLNPNIPEKLESLIYKMLDRNPEDRIESARQVQRKLKEVLRTFDEIYDSMALADYLREVDIESSERIETGQLENTGARKTANTDSHIHTTADQATQVVETEDVSTDEEWDSDFSQSRQRLPGEKKEVIVLHGEIDGFMTLRRSLRADEWTQIIQEYTRIVDSIAFKNDGLVERVNENGFVILLGLPISSRNDARRAAHMAIDLHEALEGINLSLNDTVELSIGIAVGRVFVETYPRDDCFEWSFSDDSRRLARRFSSEGLPGETVLGGQVFRRIRRKFDCESIGEIEIEVDGAGQLTPEAFRLQGTKSVSDRIDDLERSYHTFVGRELELKTLRRIFRRSILEGALGGVLLSGEEGIGKSTLVSEFLQGLDSQNVRVVRTGMSPLARDVPMSGLANVFARVLRLDRDKDLRRVRTQLEKRVSALFPNVDDKEHRMLLHSLGTIFEIEYRGGEFRSLEGDERRSRIFLTLRRLLKRYAAEIPMVIAIDDAHQLDSLTLSFFTELLDADRNLSVMFLFTGTEPLEEASRSWRVFKNSEALDVERLRELSQPNAKKLIDHLLSLHEASSKGRIDRIYEKAGGNPLFIKEMIEIFRDRGLLSRSASEAQIEDEKILPANVEGLVRAHIDRLDSEIREVLQRVALLWSPFSKEDVELVAEREFEGALEELLDRELLRPAKREQRIAKQEDADTGWYRFTNRVTKEVAEESVAPHLAESLHLEIAEYLDSEKQLEGIGDYTRIAKHFDKGGQPDKAVKYYREAAENALERRGANEALRLSNIILERVDDEDDLYWEIQELRVEALEKLGEQRERRETLDYLLDLAKSQGADSRELKVSVDLADYYFDQNNFSEAEKLVEKIDELSRELDEPIHRLRALAVEAKTLMNRGESDRGEALLNEIIDNYRRLRESDEDYDSELLARGLANSYNIRGVLRRYAGSDKSARRDFEKGLEEAKDANIGQLKRYLQGNKALTSLYLGQLADSIRIYRELLEECRQLGYRTDEALTLINLGHSLQFLGDYSSSKTKIRKGIYLARKSESRRYIADGQISLGYVYLEEGRLEQAAEVIQEGLRIADSIPSRYLSIHATLLLARVRLRSGRHDDARTALMQANDALERSEEAEMWWGEAMGYSIKARALNAIGRVDEAIEASRKAVESIDEGELFSIELIYYYHAQILPERQQYRAEREKYIREAKRVVESRLEALETEQQKEHFLSKDINRRVLNTADLVLSEESH